MITHIAQKCGFTGGLIVDFPNSKKAKKYYLFLMAGFSEDIQKEAYQAIAEQKPLDDETEEEEEKKIGVFDSKDRDQYNRE